MFSMKKTIASKFAFLAALMFAFTSFSAFAQPKILLNGGKDEFNWGDVRSKQSPVKADVEIKNVGNEVLHITNVKPSCGCTSAPIEKDSLKPGESTVIKVSLNLPTHPGDFTKSLTVSSNDPAAGTKVLMLKGKLIKMLTMDNSFLSFNNPKVNETSEAKIVLTNTSTKDITITEVNANPANLFSTNLTPNTVIKAGQKFELVGKIKPEKAGYMHTSLVFKTNSADDSDFTITGYAEVKESAIFNNK